MVKLGSRIFFKIRKGRTVFNFACKTSGFCGGGCSFWLWKVKWSEWSEVKRFLSFDGYETFICFRGVLNLNCYIGKKVQKNFLMGLKVWWSWGSRKKFSKSHQVARFFENWLQTWRLPFVNLGQILRFWNFFRPFVGFVFKGIS